jgi:uncharacterized membrane protein
MELEAKLADYQWRLQRLERELEELKREAGTRSEPAAPPIRLPAPLPKPKPAALPMQRRAPVAPARPRPRLELSDLLGARALAVAGGVVTLLGIVFFFVLAVNRGWIDPTARVGFGATASLLVFGAGLELRRRYGETHSALAAVGAGIAGGYVTLLCASAVYGLIPNAAALAFAAAIGATGLATALVWRSELVAALGLVGATLAPLAVAADNGITGVGTAFAVIALTATAVVAVRHRWRKLLFAGTAAAWPQLAALIDRYTGEAHWWLFVLVGLYALLFATAAAAWHLRWEGPVVRKTSFAFVALAAYTSAGSTELYSTEADKGWALLAAAIAFALPAVAFFGKRQTRSLAATFAAAALVLGTAAAAALLSGQSLAIVWSAESAVLAWLAARTRESRLQLWALAYFGLAVVHVAMIDAPVTRLFVENDNPTRGIATVGALTAAAAAVGLFAGLPLRRPRRKAGLLGRLPTLLTVGRRQERLRLIALWTAAALAAYGAALATLELCGGIGWDWGHVAVIGVWGGAGLGLVAAAVARRSSRLDAGAVTWVAVVLATVLAYDVPELAATPLSIALLLAAATALATGTALQLLVRETSISLDCMLFSIAAYGLATAAVVELAPSERLEGVVLLAPLGVAAAISALALRRRRREFAAVQWIAAVILAALACERLFDGTYLVVAWSATGALAALFATRAREPWLRFGALALIALAAGHALVLEAPPTDLFVAQSWPAAGAPALVALLAFGLIALRLSRPARTAAAAAWWSAGVIALYAASLAMLEFVERVSPAGLDTDFQRGHSTVSAVWGLCGLALLYAGLTRRPSLRLAGFALFGVSLVKIFVYDLPALSSITRALSFLAVGAVLLLGGFFYQRLLETKS